jgi:UDP-N-acetylglucosamine transferase subunit ALG13
VILVIMGMEVHQFDRLARAIDELQQGGSVQEDFFVQLGSCKYVPQFTKYERYLSFGALCELVTSASLVVSHAGVGSALTCIQYGKHPIIVPRRSAFGEHIDDHQLEFTKRLSELGVATPVYEVSELSAAIAEVRRIAVGTVRSSGATELTTWLDEFWRGLAGGESAE